MFVCLSERQEIPHAMYRYAGIHSWKKANERIIHISICKKKRSLDFKQNIVNGRNATEIDM